MKNLRKNNKNKVMNLDWDLEAILENQSLNTLFRQWNDNQKKLVEIYANGECYKSEKEFGKYLALDLENTKLSNRISNYISNKLNENSLDQKIRAWEQKLEIASHEYDLIFANEYNQIFKYKKQIKKFLKLPKYAIYKRVFDVIFKLEEKSLPKKSENLLANFSNGVIDVSGIYQILSSAEIKYASAYNKTGNEFKIKTETDGYLLLRKPDSKLRKTAWLSLQNAYLSHQNVIAKLLYYNYLISNTASKINKFKNLIDAQNFADEIDDKFIDLLTTNIKKYANIYKQYSRINSIAIKKKHNLKKINPWDRELPLFNINQRYSISKAKKLVLEAIKPLGKEYVANVNKIFNENWISWLPKANKQSGAYSIGGTFGLKKFYIFLNYDYTLDSVFSLIHEIGHASHSTFLSKKQTIYSETDILCAEVASLVNEILLSLYLIQKNQKNLKQLANIYDQIISNFFNTTIFQMVLYDFEVQFVKKLDNNENIDAEEIFTMYARSLVNLNLFPEKKFQKWETRKTFKTLTGILKVDHFYNNPFYVYKYAFSQIVALNIAAKIFYKDKKMLDKYLHFLTLGTSQPPLDLIKTLEINIEDDNFWNVGIKFINKLIKEYKIILKKLNLQ